MPSRAHVLELFRGFRVLGDPKVNSVVFGLYYLVKSAVGQLISLNMGPLGCLEL